MTKHLAPGTEWKLLHQTINSLLLEQDAPELPEPPERSTAPDVLFLAEQTDEPVP